MKKILITATMLFFWSRVAMAQNSAPASASPTPSPSPGVAEAERVVVSGGAIEQSESDKAQSVTILTEDNLKLQTAPTLGDTLATQPGVDGTDFTAGRVVQSFAARQIIGSAFSTMVRKFSTSRI